MAAVNIFTFLIIQSQWLVFVHIRKRSSTAVMTGGGAKYNLHKVTAKPADTSRLHQSLWCEPVELPNSTFSGVRAAVIDSLEKQVRAPGAFDQDALVSSVWEVLELVTSVGGLPFLLWKM